MEKIREWSFPVALLVAWFMAAAYSVSLMLGSPSDRPAPAKEAPPAAVATQTVAAAGTQP